MRINNSNSTRSILATSSDGLLVDIECVLSNNLPAIIIVGLANKAVNEAKERIRGAFTSSKLQLPRKRITINLAPADVPKADSSFDLAIAVSILLAARHIPRQPQLQETAFVGELSLNGQTRPVRGLIGKIQSGRKLAIRQFFIPYSALDQARLIPNITLVPVKSLRELYEHLSGERPIPAIKTGTGASFTTRKQNPAAPVSLDEIAGQERAKRGLILAAAGGHNILLSGPPGTGKSMLAKALPSLLPPLEREEMLEVTHLHSLTSYGYGHLVTERPFRSPHHSSSHTAIIGGGSALQPGEISLAHRGVLFLDELPEFNRLTLESLRQPLEDHTIHIARAKDSVHYPANFILVATANPCPCGYYGREACTCSRAHILRYQQRISGPIMDRIDIHCSMEIVDHTRLLSPAKGCSNTAEVQQHIARARQLQHARHKTPTLLNADLSNSAIKQSSNLTRQAELLLTSAAQQLNLSARAYMNIIRVARTIADLEAQSQISEAHITEAVSYRQPADILST